MSLSLSLFLSLFICISPSLALSHNHTHAGESQIRPCDELDVARLRLTHECLSYKQTKRALFVPAQTEQPVRKRQAARPSWPDSELFSCLLDTHGSARFFLVKICFSSSYKVARAAGTR